MPILAAPADQRYLLLLVLAAVCRRIGQKILLPLQVTRQLLRGTVFLTLKVAGLRRGWGKGEASPQPGPCRVQAKIAAGEIAGRSDTTSWLRSRNVLHFACGRDREAGGTYCFDRYCCSSCSGRCGCACMVVGASCWPTRRSAQEGRSWTWLRNKGRVYTTQKRI